jgi:TfoX/Sxy family transcriptional regulator of competence genes
MSMTPAQHFQRVVDGFAGDPAVSSGRMFGSAALKTRGKVFAMLVRNQLVVKLPRAQVDSLIQAGLGEAFDPGHGKLMKEWVALGQQSVSWSEVTKDARDFVARNR